MLHIITLYIINMATLNKVEDLEGQLQEPRAKDNPSSASGGPGDKQIDPGQVKTEGKGAGGMSDEEMIEYLMSKGKYFISSKDSTEKTGAYTSVIPPLDRKRTSSVSFLSSTVNESSSSSFSHRHSQNVPKIPPFSGDEPPMKGDVTYTEWRFEIRSLDRDPDISPSLLIQAIRRSLRGTARKMLVTLGEGSSVPQILTKLDSLFGDISTHGMVMQEFFNAKQRPDECVVNFGCRLESLLQAAYDNGSLNRASKNDLLRHKFWTSLHSDRLKSQTRHKYDSITSYDHLLKEIRTVEKEMNISKQASSPAAGSKAEESQKKKGKGHSHVVSCDVEQQQVTNTPDLNKEFEKKLKDIEERLSSKIDSKLDRILSKLGESGQSKSGQGQNKGQGQKSNRGRGNQGYHKNNQKSGQGNKNKESNNPNN